MMSGETPSAAASRDARARAPRAATSNRPPPTNKSSVYGSIIPPPRDPVPSPAPPMFQRAYRAEGGARKPGARPRRSVPSARGVVTTRRRKSMSTSILPPLLAGLTLTVAAVSVRRRLGPAPRVVAGSRAGACARRPPGSAARCRGDRRPRGCLWPVLGLRCLLVDACRCVRVLIAASG